MWQDEEERWTLASYIARELCQTKAIEPAELYFILVTLGIENDFREYWDCPQFLRCADVSENMVDSIDRRRDGWRALAGDIEWAKGDLDEAKRRYEFSIKKRETAGLGGLVRIHFVEGQFDMCIEAFRRGCPPNEFYLEYREYSRRRQHDSDPGMAEFNRLCRRYRGTSFAFLTNAKYMLRAIVAAAIRARGLDESLRQMVCNYFELEEKDLDELIQALTGDDDEIKKLQSKIAPKPIPRGRNLEDLLKAGATDRAQHLCDCVIGCSSFVQEVERALWAFLRTGSEVQLDHMTEAGSPFGVAEADALVIEAALNKNSGLIAEMPRRRLALLRRFSPICRYPEFDFLDDYIEVMTQIESDIEPGDIVSAILDLQWYKTRFVIDHTGIGGSPGGFGKVEIDTDREWAQIALIEYLPSLDRNDLRTRDGAIALLHSAYQFLKERFIELKSTERWISEAKLGDSLSVLFGAEEVQRHARPLWLSPQHLDFLLPRFNLAVEYQGAQHYEPVEVFGGESGFEDLKARDERKRVLCTRMNLNLEYVTYEEDIGRRAREIFAQYGG